MGEEKTTKTESRKFEKVDIFGDKHSTEKTETKIDGKKTE